MTLHGRGASAFDLLGLAPDIGRGNFLLICPQGPLEIPIGPHMMGYASMSPGGPPDVEAILSAQKQLVDFIDKCLKRYPIDREKLALLGFSQGGVMAYSLALAMPERFAALAALSSWLPRELVARLKITHAVERLPTLVQHGTRDSMIEIGRARDAAERLRELHLPLTYREYDMGHEITPESFADLSAWLDEKLGATGGRP